MARARPTPEDAAAARRILLDGLARDAGVSELLGELEPLHPRNDTFPGEIFLHLAADALDWCRASRANPLQLEGLQARFLPEPSFRGRQNKKLQYAVLAAAALHGGTEPDLLDEVAWWRTDDFWEYALCAAVPSSRCPGEHRPGPPPGHHWPGTRRMIRGGRCGLDLCRPGLHRERAGCCWYQGDGQAGSLGRSGPVWSNWWRRWFSAVCCRGCG